MKASMQARPVRACCFCGKPNALRSWHAAQSSECMPDMQEGGWRYKPWPDLHYNSDLRIIHFIANLCPISSKFAAGGGAAAGGRAGPAGGGGARGGDGW